MESKVTVWSRKSLSLSNQLSELEGKMGTASPDPASSTGGHSAQKVDALEKQKTGSR